MDGHKWFASRLDPRKWGDKLEVTGDGLEQRPILDFSQMPPDKRELLAELLRGKAIRPHCARPAKSRAMLALARAFF